VPLRWILWCAAGVSLAAGVWLSLDAVRLWDFEQALAWVQDVRHGISPFNPDAGADYPPWALVTLVPLLWIPESLRAPFWVAVNLGLVAVIVHAVTRFVPAGETRRWLIPALLCIASLRTLGQFSLLSFALALAGASTRSPTLGGVWLGLALMKPQVGGVIWLAHIGLRDWRRVGVAGGVLVLLTLVCAWGLGQTPWRLLQDYAGVIDATHGGATPFLGHTELEAWLWSAWGMGTSTTVTVALGAMLLAPGAIAVARRQPVTPAAILEWYGFCAVVSLLATRHLSYDLVLLVPLVVAWVAWPARRLQAAGLVVLTWLILHPPTWWRRVLAPMGLPEGLAVVTELDRVLCICLWAIIAVRMRVRRK
jgi:hypothetical protein